jgi:hypothetical protein
VEVTLVDRLGAGGRAGDNRARDGQSGDQKSAMALHDDLLEIGYWPG